MLWDSRSVQTNNQQRGDASLLLPLFSLTRSSHSIWPQTPGRGCGPALWLRWSLEMLAGLVKQQFTCCSVHDEDSTVQGSVRGERRRRGGEQKHNVNSWCLVLLSIPGCRPLQPDALWGGFLPLRRPLFTRLPPSLPNTLSPRDPQEEAFALGWHRNPKTVEALAEAALPFWKSKSVHVCCMWKYSWGHDGII